MARPQFIRAAERAPMSATPARGRHETGRRRHGLRAVLVSLLAGLTLPVLLADPAAAVLATAAVNPTFGPATGGTVVTVTGTDFSTAPGATRIRFGNTDGQNTTCASTTSCTTTAPSGSGTVAVRVQVGGVLSPVGPTFTYGPAVTKITPATGTPGTVVRVEGVGFAAGAGTTMRFGPNAFAAVCETTTKCTVTAPAGVGSVNVVATVAGISSPATAANVFTYNGTPPTPLVSTLSVASGRSIGGTAVTITGANFSVTTGATTVRFGATAATGVTCASTTSCTATSPAGAPGTVNVSVTVGGQTSVASPASQFTYVAPPTVTTLTAVTGPNTGGTAVNVNGTGFSTAPGGTVIRFGTGTATVAGGACALTTVCSVLTPAAATAGPVSVSATVDLQTGTLANAFTYTAVGPPGPVVTALSRPKGAQGQATPVVVTGANLGTATAVQFGATPAVFACTASSCNVVAPATLALGTFDVFVITPSGTSTASAATKFAVVPAVSPVTAPHIVTAFPQRDFVSTDQFAAADGPYTVDVIRGGQVVGRSSGLMPDAAGLMEVNHPGGGCWGTAPFGNTPDLAAGDLISVIDRWGIAEQTRVANVTTGAALQPVAAGTLPGTFKIVVRGTATGALGGQLPLAEVAHRFVVNDPKARFLFSGRRDLSATSTPKAIDGVFAYDAPGSTNWTATYDNLSATDRNLILTDVESRGIWLGPGASGAEVTIYEVGSAVAGGPQAPCVAPIEPDTIAPTAPGAPTATVQGAPNLDNVNLAWSPASDNRSLAGYRIWRDGAVVATVGPAVTSYSDLHVAVGVHAYEIQSVDGAGNVSARTATTPASVTTAAALRPDLAITLTHTPAGDLTVTNQATYRATVTNVGQFAFQGTVTVTVNLPAGIALVSTANSGSGSPFTCTGTTVVTCTTAPADGIGLGHLGDKVVDVTVLVGTLAVPEVTLTATLSSTPAVPGTGDTTAANDVASDTALVNGAPVTIVNEPPRTNPNRGVIAFPARDFVHAEGFLATDRVTVQILRFLGGNWTVIAESRGNIPDPDGFVEINHPGGGCWGGDPQHPTGGAGAFPNTPNIQPGDKVRYITQDGVADQTTVKRVKVQRPFSPAPGVIVVRGSAQNDDGTPMSLAAFEQRMVAVHGLGLFESNGKRTLRASGVAADGVVTRDAPGSINWTATYTGLSANDVARALDAEARAQWLGNDPIALNELTIFENDPAIAKGPSAPCVAPADTVTPINPVPDLAITSSHAGDFTVAAPGTYNLAVQNVGTLATNGTVQVLDVLPVGLGYVSGGAGSGFTCNAVGRNVTCTSSASIAPGASVVIPLNVTVANTAVPGVANLAEVSVALDDSVMNNYSSDATTVNPAVVVSPDLAVTVAHGQDFTAGSTGETFSVTVTNAATAGPADGPITVTDVLPSGLTFQSGGNGTWVCNAVGSTVSCVSAAGLAPGASTTFTVNVLVGAAAVPSVTNTASVAVAGSQVDAHLIDNTDSDVTTVIPNVSAPTGGLHLIAFPSRDFVSIDGLTAAQGPVLVSVLRNGNVIATSPPMTPVDDPATVIFDGFVDVNHIGVADCWNITPDIQPGDRVRVTDAQQRSYEITVGNVRADVAVSLGGGVVEVHGTAQDASGNPLPLGQIQQRLIKAKTAPLFEGNGRRELRTGNDGTIAYDRPGAISWTATYTGLSANDVAGALAAESRIVSSPNLLAGNDLTIFEAGVAGGPAVGGCSPLFAAEADLGVVVTTDAAGPVVAGTVVTVTVTVTNNGPTAVNDATIQVTLPGDAAIAGIGGGDTQVLNVGVLGVGGTSQVTFTITPNAVVGDRIVTAWVRTASHDYSAANDFATARVTVV